MSHRPWLDVGTGLSDGSLQYWMREGLCLDAGGGDDLVRVDDLAGEERWPAFSLATVTQLGVHSMLSVRLRLKYDVHSALKFYARCPCAA
jgi:hypothetical protein